MLESLETRRLLSTYYVANCNDSGVGSLRQAILDVNNDRTPDNIEFDIFASTSPDLSIPVSGFDPTTQTWRIKLNSPLPTITNTVMIDGYSQAHVGNAVPFRYPTQTGLAVQNLSLVGSPTGGSFYLKSQDMYMSEIPIGPLSPSSTVQGVQDAMDNALGTGIVTVTSQNGSDGPLWDNPMFLTFGGPFAHKLLLGLTVPIIVTDANGDTVLDANGKPVYGNSLTGGTKPGVADQMVSVGGSTEATPTYIKSAPNSTPALTGNNARDRVIIDGSGMWPQLPLDPTAKFTNGSIGFEINASHSTLRGLNIVNFAVGVQVDALVRPNDPVVGTLIQGNFIGDYFYYPVDPTSGLPLPPPNSVGFTSGQGNGQQGVVLFSSNCTVGGSNPQECNVIDGNGLYIDPRTGKVVKGNDAQGILLRPGASGNQILGNQIGVAGPSDNGLYVQDGNTAEGVLILSTGSLSDPLGITYSSSNFIGSATGGNVISSNGGAGVHIVGVGANRNLVQGNYIGVAPEEATGLARASRAMPATGS